MAICGRGDKYEVCTKIASCRRENEILSSQLAVAKIRANSLEANVEQWKKAAHSAQKKASEIKKSHKRKEEEKKAKIQRKQYIESLTSKKSEAMTVRFPNPLYHGGEQGGKQETAAVVVSREICDKIVGEILEVI